MKYGFRLLLALAVLCLMPMGSTALADAPSGTGAQKAILVTGATSGIGRNITEKLAAQGHYVYAGGRKAADIAELSGLDNVEGIQLDVTVQGDIEAAVAHIEAAGRGLYGVVNNAGVARFAPMNTIAESDIDFVFDVNVYGPYRVNRAFTPLLDAADGRTLIIGSISGFTTGPNGGTYSMSKFAVEAYSEALAAELKGLGITVAVVEPGGYKSKIREKVTRAMVGATGVADADLTMLQRQALERGRASNDQLKEPDAVSDAVLHALFSDQPKFRYMVVPDQGQANSTITAALRRVVQLNADQPYGYSRAELIAKLDELMAETKPTAKVAVQK